MMDRTIVALTLIVALLTAVTAQAAGPLYFDASQAGATPTWDNATTATWSAVSGSDYTHLWGYLSNYNAHFEGTGNSVAVSGAVNNINSISFDVDGYTLDGGTLSTNYLTLTGTGGNVDVASGTAALNAIVKGSVGLAKTGAGTLSLGKANSYTGGTTISAGTLQVDAHAAVPASGGIVNNGSLVFKTWANNQGYTTGISGSGSVTISTGNRHFKNGGTANSYTGLTTITGANTSLAIRTDGMALGTADAGTVVEEGAALQLTGVTISDEPLTLYGTGIASNGALQGQGYAVNTFDGPITLGSDSLIGNQSGANTPTLLKITSATPITGDYTLGFTSASTSQNIEVSSSMNMGGDGGIYKTGNGTAILSGASGYAGATTIYAGILQIVGNNRLPTGTAVTLTPPVEEGEELSTTAAFDLNGYNQTIASLDGGWSGGGNVTLGAGTLTVGSGAYAGAVSGAGGSLIKTGSGTLTLSGANTHTGATTVEAGALQLGPLAHDAVLNLGGADIKGGKMAFDYAGGSTPATTVASLLATSYNGGAWDVGQFKSSTADANHGLGWADDGTNSLLTVQYALYGDADLNGAVDVNDLNALINNYGTTSGAIWAGADFNYDGAVDVNDLNAIVNNYGGSMSVLRSSLRAAGMAVPEPSSLLLLAAGLAGLLAYAWKKRR